MFETILFFHFVKNFFTPNSNYKFLVNLKIICAKQRLCMSIDKLNRKQIYTKSAVTTESSVIEKLYIAL